MTGTAGGLNADGLEQGNDLVTVDAAGATITGNTFRGTTTRYGVSLRARGPATAITGNTFDSTHLTATAGQVDVENTGQTVGEVAAANTFDKGVYADGAVGEVAISLNFAAAAAPAGTTLHALAGTYTEQVTLAKSVHLLGAGRALHHRRTRGHRRRRQRQQERRHRHRRRHRRRDRRLHRHRPRRRLQQP